MIRMAKIGVLFVLYFVSAATGLFQTQVSDSYGINSKDNNILISDLAALIDSKYLDEKDTNLWKAIPYQTENFSGVMLGDGGGPEPIPLTIKPGIEGIYRVYLGIYSGYSSPCISIRLSRDAFFQTVDLSNTQCRDDVYERGAHIYEIPWKEADLTGQDIILKGVKGADSSDILQSALAFIRLEPVTSLSEKSQEKDFFPLMITNDGHGIFSGPLHSCPEDLLKDFEKIPEESCMSILLWGNGCADNCNYPTQVGNFYPNAGRSFRNAWKHKWSMNMGQWKEKGWNSLQVVRDYAKMRKWEFHVYIRMEAFAAQFPFDQQEHSNFFYAHPEYHCLDRKGQKIIRLSYAYPEVQEYMLSLIKEISEYEPDGICLCFIRGVPLVHYEPIMVEGFKDKYGIDPRDIPEYDPRWIEYQGDIVTSFVKKVKNVLSPTQRLSAIVPGNEFDCKRWGLDIPAWLKSGIIDDLYPVGQRFDHRDVHRDNPEKLDFNYFANLEGRKGIRLIPVLYPWNKFNDDYSGWRQLMYTFLDQGADGYGVWDAAAGDIYPRVGEIGYEAKSGYNHPEVKFRKIKVISVQGFRIDRYHMFEVI